MKTKLYFTFVDQRHTAALVERGKLTALKKRTWTRQAPRLYGSYPSPSTQLQRKLEPGSVCVCVMQGLKELRKTGLGVAGLRFPDGSGRRRRRLGTGAEGPPDGRELRIYFLGVWC